MSRSPRWRNRRRKERQAEAAARAVVLPCGCRSSQDPDEHWYRAHSPEVSR